MTAILCIIFFLLKIINNDVYKMIKKTIISKGKKIATIKYVKYYIKFYVQQ